MSKIHKLYLLEGMEDRAIHSLALEIKDSLQQQGRHVVLYTEGMLHPADMASHAYLTMEEYYEFVHDVFNIWRNDRIGTKEELTELIAAQTSFEDGHAIIAHQMLIFPSPAYSSLLADLSAREIYDGKLAYPRFLRLHLTRWKSFSKQALSTPNTSFIFLNTLFKNHITELMGFYDMEDERIISHLTLLLKQVITLNPCLLYQREDRLTAYLSALPSSYKDTLRSQAEGSNYGRVHGLKGSEGLLHFFENRQRIEDLSLLAFSELSPELTLESIELGCET